MAIPSVRSIEELLLGHLATSTLEGRVATSVSLLVCLGSAISMILNAFFTTFEQTCLSALGTFISGFLYLFLRKSGRWEPLALPGCLIFLVIVAIAWATDTGSYSTAGYFFFMVVTVSSIVLRRRYLSLFVTLTVLTLGIIFVREHFTPLPVLLDAPSRLRRLGDTAFTLPLCIVIIAAQIRIVIRQHLRDKEEIVRAMDEIRTLRGMLPICSKCKKIRDRSGYWSRIEEYIVTHSATEFSHGFCPECLAELYSEYGLAPLSPGKEPAPSPGATRSTAPAYAVPHPLEELLLGTIRSTPLEARIFNAIALLLFLTSSATTIMHVLMRQFTEVCTTTVATVLSGTLYLHLRKSRNGETILLPVCLAFLWLLSIDWAFDPAGSYGSDPYYYILIASVMPLALRQRHKTFFVILTVFIAAGILLKESFFSPFVTLDPISRHRHLLDIASAAVLCLFGLFATVRLVIREHVRDKHRLAAALDEIKVLRGLLPICAKCKKIRDKNGYWNLIEEYMANHSEAEFSECLCPDCLKKTIAEKRADPGAKQNREIGSAAA
jgi:hypothetical protein